MGCGFLRAWVATAVSLDLEGHLAPLPHGSIDDAPPTFPELAGYFYAVQIRAAEPFLSETGFEGRFVVGGFSEDDPFI